jgi:hypothetical protein
LFRPKTGACFFSPGCAEKSARMVIEASDLDRFIPCGKAPKAMVPWQLNIN